MLRKAQRLRSSARIQELRHSGRSWHNRWLVLLKGANGSHETRFAVSVSRRIGTAVTRNRVRRLVREAIRRHLPTIQGGWDVLVITRAPASDAQFGQIERAVADLLQRSRLQIERAIVDAPEPNDEQGLPGVSRSDIPAMSQTPHGSASPSMRQASAIVAWPGDKSDHLRLRFGFEVGE